MIARTETIRASARGSQALYQSWDVKAKQWHTVADDRRCPWCAEMDGTIIPIGGTFFEKDTDFTVPSAATGNPVTMKLTYEAVQGPPLHPNCRCQILPVLPSQGLPNEVVEEPVSKLPPTSQEPPWRVPAGYDPGKDQLETNKLAREHIIGDSGAAELRQIDINERTRAKELLIRKLAERTGRSLEEVNTVIAQWAITSNGEDMRSLQLQEDASVEFGTPMSDWAAERRRSVRSAAELHRSTDPETYYARLFGELPERPTETVLHDSATQRHLLREMYDITQERLESDGVPTTVRLYRGFVADELSSDIKLDTQLPIATNSMSSWSVNFETAKMFSDLPGRTGDSIVFEMDIPRTRILSTARTGFGCLTEGEFVVLGSQSDTANVVHINRRSEEW